MKEDSSLANSGTVEASNAKPFRDFISAFLLSALLMGVAIGSSVYASHMPIQELGGVRLALSATVPIICGLLSVASKGKFVDALANAASNWGV